MIPGSGGGNQNPNMQMPGFGIPQPGVNIISAPPIITGPRFGMGMPPTMMGGMFPGAGLGMMPNPAMGNPMVPGMFPGMMQNVPPPMGHPAPVIIPTEQPPVDMVEAAFRKVFVKNIPEDVPDTFMETILKECGNIAQWKRTKNEKDIPLRFGTCEFETVEGMLRCLRIMNNLRLLDSYLQINASDKTEAFIGEWTETKKKEWQASKDPSAREEDFERSLQKDDANALERIHILIDNFDVNKAREAKEKEEEKKEHPKEKERDRKKKTQQKELEKNFKKELQKWQEYEDKMDKDRRKEKDREREREQEKEKFKQRLLEKELEYDSEEERRRKSNTKYLEQRKRTRQRELEDDELERRKEIMEEEEKRKANEESQMEIEPPMENIMPIHSHDLEEKPTINPKPRSKFMFQTIEPGVQEPAPQTDGGKPAFQLDIGGPAQKAAKGGAQTLFKEDMEKEDEAMQLYNRKHKIQAKVEKPATTTENVVTVDRSSGSATIQFGVTVPVAPTNEAQKVLSELQSLIKQIPTNKSDLFSYKINWTLLATSDLIEKKVKPWLKKQSVEYIGQEEMDFVNMILKRLANRESPQKIMEKVEKLLDEEAEDFTMKLWRMLIFELLKLEHTSQLEK